MEPLHSILYLPRSELLSQGSKITAPLCTYCLYDVKFYTFLIFPQILELTAWAVPDVLHLKILENTTRIQLNGICTNSTCTAYTVHRAMADFLDYKSTLDANSRVV